MSYTPQNPYPTDDNPFSYMPPEPPAPKRSKAATIVGWFFVALTTLFLLAGLKVLATPSEDTSTPYLLGRFIGLAIFVGIPGFIAYLCLTSHKRKAKKTRY